MFNSIKKKPISVLLGSSLFAQLITITSLPLVTRIYDPNTIGAVSIFIAFIGISSILANLRYDGALLLSNDKEEIESLVSLTIIIALVMSLITSALLSFMCYLDLFGFTVLPVWVGIIAFPTTYALALSSICRTMQIREARYTILAFANIVRNTSNVLTRLLGFFVGGGLIILLTAEIVSAVAGTYYLSKGIFFKKKISFSSKTHHLIHVAKKWINFPKFELPSVFLDQMAFAIPLFIINTRFGSDFAGIFFMAQRVVTLPNLHIGSAYSEIFRSKFAELIRAGKSKEAKNQFNKFLSKIVFIAVIVAFPMAILVPNFIGLLLGDEWLLVGVLMPWLVLWATTSLVVSSLSPILPLMQKQKYKLIYDISTLAFISIAFILARQESILFHVQALSLANTISNFIYLMIMIKQSRKL